MSSVSTPRENDQDERTIRSLCDRTGAPHADVQALFAEQQNPIAVRRVMTVMTTITTATMISR